MIQTKVVNKLNLPDIALQDDLAYIARNIIIPDIIMGIDASKAISGGFLPHNEPSTIAYKRKHGLGNKPLIATGELRSSFFYKTVGTNKVVISIAGNRKAIGGHLQKGIMTRSGLKQYRFFGISKDASNQAIAYIIKRIKELTRGRRKK